MSDKVTGPGRDRFHQLFTLFATQTFDHDRFAMQIAVAGPNGHLIEVLQHIGSLGVATAPPGRHRRNQQFLAQQFPAQQRQERQKRGTLQQSAPERIDHRDFPRPNGLHHSGNAQRRIAAQFQRIAVDAINPPQNRIDAPQAAQSLEHHLFVTGGQIAPLDDHIAQISRQVRIFEIIRIRRPLTHQNDLTVFTSRRRQPFQQLPQCHEERGQALNLPRSEAVGVHPRRNQAIFQRIASPGW